METRTGDAQAVRTPQAVAGAWRLIEVANALAGLQIEDVAGLAWTDDRGPNPVRVRVHLRSEADVERFADAQDGGVTSGEVVPGAAGSDVYQRRAGDLLVFCAAGARHV